MKFLYTFKVYTVDQRECPILHSRMLSLGYKIAIDVLLPDQKDTKRFIISVDEYRRLSEAVFQLKKTGS